MPHCITSKTVEKVNFIQFDGKNWENSFEKDTLVKKMSKE